MKCLNCEYCTKVVTKKNSYFCIKFNDYLQNEEGVGIKRHKNCEVNTKYDVLTQLAIIKFEYLVLSDKLTQLFIGVEEDPTIENLKNLRSIIINNCEKYLDFLSEDL